jgi:hypothetical protein
MLLYMTVQQPFHSKEYACAYDASRRIHRRCEGNLCLPAREHIVSIFANACQPYTRQHAVRAGLEGIATVVRLVQL